MRGFLALLALLALVVGAGRAADYETLGYSHETTIVGPGTDACADGVLHYSHDGSFENGYAWAYRGVQLPYYGAFGEGYDLGEGFVRCGAYWLSTMPGFYDDQTADCYVWEGGTDAPPDAVLGVVTGVVFENVAIWPEVGQNDIDLNIFVAGPFTVGYWGNWPGAMMAYYCAGDLDGPRGHPWTCVAPGLGYPTGWMDPALIWTSIQSMGCGIYFDQGTPIEGPTWGTIKALFLK
jgi:hypothetical protein